jgi:hypothetical protein
MDEKRPRKSSPVWMIVIVLLLVSGPLYFLSAGPAVWLCSRAAITEDQLHTAYAPVLRLDKQNATFSRAMRWYVNLWVPGEPPPSEPP